VDDIDEFLSSYSGDADNVRPASGYRVGELRVAVVADRDLLHRLHDSVRVNGRGVPPRLQGCARYRPFRGACPKDFNAHGHGAALLVNVSGEVERAVIGFTVAH
jgi:hypothetical protein